MKVYYIENLASFSLDNQPRNAIIGFFDGVHRGHQLLINNAYDSNLINTIITFDVHINKESLLDTSQKIELLKNFGYDEIFVIKSNAQNMNCDYKAFNQILLKNGVVSIAVGEDFKYGKNAKGNINTLKEDFTVNIQELVLIDNQKISSSVIRNLVKAGDIKKVNQMLGHNYTIRGRVIKGDQIGRTIDFPTANIVSEGLCPNVGTYMTKTKINDIIYQSLTNIGIRPTITDSDCISIETYIIDFNEDIYGKIIDVEIIDYIRGEFKFNSLDELKAQIQADIKLVKEK